MAVHYFDPNGVESLRDNGYRDTAMALSELIDNSIQAEANKIEILLIERLSNTGRKEYLVNEIVVIDNGLGMDKKIIETSLRFGGGTRHGASKGLGKFGMGLPNSSSSQCSRFEVYSWRKSNHVLFNYFDFNEIKETQSEFLPEVCEKEIPDYIKNAVNPIFKTGTIVRWVDCDRLIYRRSSRLVPHIEWPLGKTFRYFIDQQKVEIKIRVFQDNGSSLSEQFGLAKTIKPVDPLFLMTDTQLDPPYNAIATNKLWEDGEYLFPDPKGNRENKQLYKLIGESVKIKCSIAKKETKRLGGSSPLGRIYGDLIGLSVVRASREIKHDSFGFITDTSEQTNRWWKVEICFSPSMDKYFGLDNTKQNVHAFKKIKDKDELERSEDDVQLEFICLLSEFIENVIKKMKLDIDAIDSGTRGGQTKPGTNNGGNNDDQPTPPDCGPFPPDTVPVPKPGEDTPDDEPDPDEEEKKELRKWLLLRYPEYGIDEAKLQLAINWFFKTTSKQIIVFLQLGDVDLYNFKPIGHRTIIEINTKHDFYLEFMKPIFDENDLNKIDPMLLLFGAMAESEKELVSYNAYITKFRSLFAFKLNQFIFDWKENK
jgi:hypothetical protein